MRPEGAARGGQRASLTPVSPPACSGVWDNITCWRPADVGETVTVPCPKLFSNVYNKPGTVRAAIFELFGGLVAGTDFSMETQEAGRWWSGSSCADLAL